MIELTHQSYETLMDMPYQFFEDFLKWKTDMEREQSKRQRTEIEAQKGMQNKIKAEQSQKMAGHRIKDYMKKR